MKKQIPFAIAPDCTPVLDTHRMQIPDFVELFLEYALQRVRGMAAEKKVKTVAAAVDLFTDIVDEEFTYFLRHNDGETKEQILEWLLEAVVGGYMNHFLRQDPSAPFDPGEEGSPGPA